MILVDSDVLIEHLRGSTAARDWLVQARQSSGPLAISVVSLTEIAGGMRSPERREVMRLQATTSEGYSFWAISRKELSCCVQRGSIERRDRGGLVRPRWSCRAGSGGSPSAG